MATDYDLEFATRTPAGQVAEELVWLLRRGGEVSLPERDDLWTSEWLALVGERPHHRRTWSLE